MGKNVNDRNKSSHKGKPTLDEKRKHWKKG